MISLQKGVSYKGEFLDKPGPRLLGLGTIELGGGLMLDKARTYSGPIRQRQYARPGDLLLAVVGITPEGSVIGSPALIPLDAKGEFAITHHVARADIKSKGSVDTRFLYYLLRSQDFADYVRGVQYGSTVPAVSIPDILSYEAAVPSIKEQRSIAHVLGSLDDKVELNRRVNQTLEQITQALFKFWFVDFGPVRAKQEGRWKKGEGLSGMPADMWDLWPSEFEESESGEIPKGWSLGHLEDLATVTMGQSPPGSTYNEEGQGLPFYQGVRDFGRRFPTRRVYCTEPTRFSQPGDVLLSVRAPIGRTNIATERCAIGRGLCSAMFHRGGASFGWGLLNSQSEAWETLEARGTVFGAATKDDLRKLPVVVPPDQFIERFELFSEIVDRSLLNSHLESGTLSSTRDALLPKLLSGEIRVGQESSE